MTECECETDYMCALHGIGPSSLATAAGVAAQALAANSMVHLGVVRAIANEEQRVAAAFRAEIERNPGVAPGPKAIAERMGLSNTRDLNGRITKHRTRLLEEHGFVKDEETGRWVRGTANLDGSGV